MPLAYAWGIPIMETGPVDHKMTSCRGKAMSRRKKEIEALIRNAVADAGLSELAQERIDEIHRSAMFTANEIAGCYDQWSGAFEAALYKELQRRQGEIKRLRERSMWAHDGLEVSS